MKVWLHKTSPKGFHAQRTYWMPDHVLGGFMLRAFGYRLWVWWDPYANAR
jgi:hypothetical protein